MTDEQLIEVNPYFTVPTHTILKLLFLFGPRTIIIP